MATVELVVRRSRSAQANDGSDLTREDDVEPSLLPPSRRLARRFALHGIDTRYLTHLEHRIERNPRNLRAHAERVLMHRVRNDARGASGALLDLFLVLGPNGLALRRRLLDDLSGLIPKEEVAFFRTHLEQGLRPRDVSMTATGSRLGQRIRGTVELVRRRQAESPRSANLVDLARESIARGHDEAALDLLEGALGNDPGHANVCRELLALYESGDYRERFFATYAALIGRGLACAERWSRLAYNFSKREPNPDVDWLAEQV